MILVAGEALVDRITDAHGISHDMLGGGPFNAARALAALGCPTVFLGGISTDDFGDEIATALQHSGVTLDLPRVTERTGIAHAQLDASGAATYRFELQGSACTQVTVDQALAAVAKHQPTALHIGTLALVLEPLVEATIALTQAVSDETLCFVDPNCRPTLVADESAYLDRLHAVLARADVVKVSADDLAFMAPNQAPDQAAADLVVGRTQVVLLTLGEAGVRVFTRDGVTSVPAVTADLVDTVGAGDVFGAGWLAAWCNEGRGCAELIDTPSVIDAARYGVRAAAWTVGHAGAQVPSRADLERSDS